MHARCYGDAGSTGFAGRPAALRPTLLSHAVFRTARGGTPARVSLNDSDKDTVEHTTNGSPRLMTEKDMALSRELLAVYRAMQASRAWSEPANNGNKGSNGIVIPNTNSAHLAHAMPPVPTPPQHAPLTSAPARELPPVWADACLSPAALYNTVGEMGASKVRQPLFKTLVLSMLAGCYTSFGACLTLTVGANCPGLAASNPGLQRAIMGLYGLPIGAIMAILTGAELFTGNLGLYASAVYQHRVPKRAALRAAAAAYVGNLAGALVMVALVWLSGVFATAAAPAAIAQFKVALSFQEAFFRGVLCTWLLNLGVWQAAAATSVIGKTIGLLVPLSAFVAMGFEHSIANMFFIPLGMANGASVTVYEFFTHSLLPVSLGNVVGGAVCVAGSYALAWTGPQNFFFGRTTEH